jgi:protein subunit release factor B
MSNKELLFSVTASDCEWSYTRGSGNGGQKKNKTSSAVHCMHRPSGAHGYSEESRSQKENKISAFTKMVNTKEFKDWHYLETLRRNGKMMEIDASVEKEMKKIKVEVKENGKWIEESKAVKE